VVTSNGSAAEGTFVLFFSSQLYPDSEELKPWWGQERAISLLPVQCPGQQLSLLLNRCHGNLIASSDGTGEI